MSIKFAFEVVDGKVIFSRNLGSFYHLRMSEKFCICPSKETFETLAAPDNIMVLFAALRVRAHAQYCTRRSEHAHYCEKGPSKILPLLNLSDIIRVSLCLFVFVSQQLFVGDHVCTVVSA